MGPFFDSIFIIELLYKKDWSKVLLETVFFVKLN